MASKIAKSTILSKAMKNNTFQVRRVVSCAPTAENNTIGVINAAVTQVRGYFTKVSYEGCPKSY